VDAIQGAHLWLDRLSVSLVTEEQRLRAERLALDAARAELLASEEERHQAGEVEYQRREQELAGVALEIEAVAKLQEAEQREAAAAQLELDSRCEHERQDVVEPQLEEHSLALSQLE
jgi:hypothetical protein